MPGPILNTAGAVVGQHRGLPNYTIGQRKGLELTPVPTRPNGIGPKGQSDKRPSYVIQLLKDKNALIVGDDAELRIRDLTVEGVNIVSGIWPDAPFRASVKIRSHATEIPATIEPLPFDPDVQKMTTAKRSRAYWVCAPTGESASFWTNRSVRSRRGRRRFSTVSPTPMKCWGAA